MITLNPQGTFAEWENVSRECNRDDNLAKAIEIIKICNAMPGWRASLVPAQRFQALNEPSVGKVVIAIKTLTGCGLVLFSDQVGWDDNYSIAVLGFPEDALSCLLVHSERTRMCTNWCKKFAPKTMTSILNQWRNYTR